MPKWPQSKVILFDLKNDIPFHTKAKHRRLAGISKLSGQAKAATYPQPEGTLGETMTAYGRKLGEESVFGTVN